MEAVSIAEFVYQGSRRPALYGSIFVKYCVVNRNSVFNTSKLKSYKL